MSLVSIIICSRTNSISKDLSQNILDTIGSEYELIIIDNTENRYSVCSAYNLGVKKSKGDILCFIHDDILFYTKDWGNILKKCFEQNTIGLVGVVGGHYLPKKACTWGTSNIISGNILQGYIEDGVYRTKICGNSRYRNNENVIDVVAVDGLFMATKKTIFEKISWDEKHFDNFHLYDMDICMQIQSIGYRVVVLDNLLIEHKSSGNYNSIWASYQDIWYKKWESYLPIVRGVPEDLVEIQWCNRAIQQERNYQSILSSKTYKMGQICTFPCRIIKSIFKK